MLQALVSSAQQMLGDFRRAWGRSRPINRPAHSPAPTSSPTYRPLRRVLLTDGVARTLFDEFADHRARENGENETGWMLLGHREADEALVLATLPAGADYDAGVAHVRFNSSGQALGARIVRQADRKLVILGVVHTHPGSLRHPSDGDFRGDSKWIKQLRGQEGIFGIGTADAPRDNGMVAWQPKPHVHCLGDLRFSWYTLRPNEAHYRPIDVELTIGPDLARSLHPLWPALENHADRIDRLCRQQAHLTFEVIGQPEPPTLVLNLPLAESGDAVRVLVRNKEVRYLVCLHGAWLDVDQRDELVDRGVYQLLAELASRS